MEKRTKDAPCLKTIAASLHGALCLRWPTWLAIALFRRKNSVSGRIKSILVVRPDGLGDCVLTLPLLDTLRRCFPSACLTVVAAPVSAPLLTRHSAVTATVVLRPALASWWPKYLRGLLGALRVWYIHLRGRHFDIAIFPRWDADIYHGTLLCMLSRAPVRIGYADGTTAYKASLCRGFQRAWTVPLPVGAVRHEAESALETAYVLGRSRDLARPCLEVKRESLQSAQAWLDAAIPGSRSRPLIAVGLPAGEAKKRWPAALYLEALQTVAQNTSVAFVLFADASTLSTAEQSRKALQASSIAYEMPLTLTAAVLSLCALFVGTDSGLGHLAAAVQCATVTLFAQAADCADQTGWYSNSPQRFHPLSGSGIVLQPYTARLGCESGCRASEPHCILDISPARVADAICSVLQGPACATVLWKETARVRHAECLQ